MGLVPYIQPQDSKMNSLLFISNMMPNNKLNLAVLTGMFHRGFGKGGLLGSGCGFTIPEYFGLEIPAGCMYFFSNA